MTNDSYLWYALQVKPRFERAIGGLVASKGYDVFVPVYASRRKWADRYKTLELPLFPGYVFSRFDVMSRLPVMTTPGVVKIVGHGRNPVAVETAEIDAIRQLVRSGLKCESCPYVAVGQRVRVIRGSLQGLEGTLVEIKKQYRVVVSIGLLQRSVSVEVDQSWIEPLRVRTPQFNSVLAASRI